MFYSMFICGHDLFWKESFCWRFAFLILFHFQCILTTENFQLSSKLKTTSSYFVISTLVISCCLIHWGMPNQFFIRFLPAFLPFLNASFAQKWKKNIYKTKYRAGNIMQWLCRAIKLYIISVKIYTAILVKVTFEIKSNI